MSPLFGELLVTGAELAPKTEETFQLLQGRHPQAQIKAISDEAMQFTPEHPVQLEAKFFTNCLSVAHPDQHQGQVGAPMMLRVCLDDAEVLQLFWLAAEDFARGSAPEEITWHP